jgi:hypothetical protein
VHKDDYVIPGQITTSDHWFFFSHGNLCFWQLQVMDTKSLISVENRSEEVIPPKNRVSLQPLFVTCNLHTHPVSADHVRQGLFAWSGRDTLLCVYHQKSYFYREQYKFPLCLRYSIRSGMNNISMKWVLKV